MIYVRINEMDYPARIDGKMADKDWDSRESKAITLEMDYATANEIFVDNMAWSIVEKNEVATYQVNDNGDIVFDENGQPIQTGTEIKETEWDNSDFNIAGDITVHKDGTITAKMGKLTDLESAYEILLGGAE